MSTSTLESRLLTQVVRPEGESPIEVLLAAHLKVPTVNPLVTFEYPSTPVVVDEEGNEQ